MVSTLERNAPKIEENIEKCEKEIQEQENSKIPILFADIRPIIIQDDLANEKIPPRSNYEKYFPILQKFNIFSTDWIVRYGVPPTSSNFDCSIKNKPGTGYGIITGIEKATIRMRDVNNKIYGIDLSICT